MLEPYYRLHRQISRARRVTHNVSFLINRDGRGVRIEIEQDVFLQAGEGCYLDRTEVKELIQKLFPDDPTFH